MFWVNRIKLGADSYLFNIDKDFTMKLIQNELFSKNVLNWA